MHDPIDLILEAAGLRPDCEGLWCDPSRMLGVALSPAGLFVGWLDVGWTATGEPFDEMRDVTHLSPSVALPLLERDLGIALAEATGAREEHLRRCLWCGGRYVPGRMYAMDRCQGCAPGRRGEG
ncbi:hypothetical protein [Patulibacter sp. SYSU D01012]|uniref:hypothetical protein n=1 Tax=Patulibacter sp. SYSU D01012 TaxID=2817381 RepID=UPI001B30BF86|nr:hypothetical protein [Patulibacter sp. SYSU D01012]